MSAPAIEAPVLVVDADRRTMAGFYADMFLRRERLAGDAVEVYGRPLLAALGVDPAGVTVAEVSATARQVLAALSAPVMSQADIDAHAAATHIRRPSAMTDAERDELSKKLAETNKRSSTPR
ncbi:hypothetical protein ABZ135_01400 [Streptomyces sp. NPDC006339]|uniref:hypothetical protein n=1 Tax=Streptomyces sp. NPDC006339 TaxID=3156755 RepID=UPI0033BAD5E7